MKIIKIVENQDISALISKISAENNNPNSEPVETQVLAIIEQIKKFGDEAIIKLSQQFDNNIFANPNEFLVPQAEIIKAELEIDRKLLQSLKTAYKRIFAFHKKQMPKSKTYRDSSGVMLGNIWNPLDSVAIYVPGGTAIYPSSLLMSAVPAIVAGCKEITVFTPQKNNQEISRVILATASICNIKNIYRIGGAQAVAAATFGTKNINKCSKIIGPGNSFVATAKKMLFGEIGIDSIAGPTDLTIICENNIEPKTNIKWLALDAISQLEHGTDSKVFIITDDINFANKITKEINLISCQLPRKEIIMKSMLNSAIFVVDNLQKQAPDIANIIAPEHLQIITNNPNKMLSKIKNAGAIFLGQYTPEAIGDYIAGPSHVLPTSGTAKFSSGLAVFDFLTRSSVISCNKKSFNKIASDAINIANSEALHGHSLSLSCRLNQPNKQIPN